MPTHHSELDVTLKVNDVVVELPDIDHVNVWRCRSRAHHGGRLVDQLLDVLGPLGNDDAG